MVDNGRKVTRAMMIEWVRREFTEGLFPVRPEFAEKMVFEVDRYRRRVVVTVDGMTLWDTTRAQLIAIRLMRGGGRQ